MDHRIDRRSFLRRSGFGVAGVALLGGMPVLLSACGDDDDTEAAGSGGEGGFGDLKIQFSWIKNAEFAGNYVADSKGYYLAEGFSSVELIGGGPTTDTISPIVGGQAMVGFAGSEQVAQAVREQEAPLRIIGANFQRNPFCIVYMSDEPLATPEDLRGKTIGVQAANELTWKALLQINQLEEGTGPDQVNRVPVEFDPSPLISGDVDGFFSFITNEPNILIAKGHDVGALSLVDLGFNLYQQIYIVTEETFNERKDALVAFMRAESKGWQEALANPQLAADLTLNVYGKDLGLIPEATIPELEDQKALQDVGITKEKGLFYMGEEDLGANLATLELLGLTIDRGLYTNEILDEVYKDGINLLEA